MTLPVDLSGQAFDLSSFSTKIFAQVDHPVTDIEGENLQLAYSQYDATGAVCGPASPVNTRFNAAEAMKAGKHRKAHGLQ